MSVVVVVQVRVVVVGVLRVVVLVEVFLLAAPLPATAVALLPAALQSALRDDYHINALLDALKHWSYSDLTYPNLSLFREELLFLSLSDRSPRRSRSRSLSLSVRSRSLLSLRSLLG